ncbi:40S ribosomal protein S10b-like [Leucoraja erinacea]|uniref:40S ribosomal protein S10b-like n=1 Tax=Leucoraja erinaceus TaxID=7782 RepID=UPI002455D6D7|nr:40S ribosomal protein S10b-like [Leucoraja erinacea]
MVAGMLLPLSQLRALYELLFRDGVVVAKESRCPQSRHPELRALSNLQVIRALGSLKSRGLVRESFVWRHHYWYLTDQGVGFLRQYLHLPPDIVPATLQRQAQHRPSLRAPGPLPRPSPRPPGSSTVVERGRQEYRKIEELRDKKGPEVGLVLNGTPSAG